MAARVQDDQVTSSYADISSIQLSSTESIFKKSIELFMHKWKALRDPAVDSFLTYFHEQWVVRSKTNNNKMLYFVGAGTKRNLEKHEVEYYMQRRANQAWDDLDELVYHMFSLWLVQVDEADWRLGQCSCPHFAKNYMCKHVIALSAQLGLHTFSVQAKSVPVGEKRKRGRPAVARPALIRM